MALLILGGVCLINCIFALFFKPLPKHSCDIDLKEAEACEPMLEEDDKKSTNMEKETLADMILLLRNWVFMMFAISNFLTSLGYPIPYAFIPVHN